MKTLTFCALFCICVTAYADPILLEDRRQISGSRNVVMASDFALFDASMWSSAGSAMQRSLIDGGDWSGQMQVVSDGRDTSTFQSLFWLRFMVSELCNYVLDARFNSISDGASTYYRTGLNGAVISESFTSGSVVRTGLIGPGEYVLEIMTSAFHAQRDYPVYSQIDATFDFTIAPQSVPEPAVFWPFLVACVGVLFAMPREKSLLVGQPAIPLNKMQKT